MNAVPSTIRLAFQKTSLSLLGLLLFNLLATQEADAQNIIRAEDGTGTTVNQDGGQFNIEDGTSSGNNLFHSFEEFGLDASEVANFILENPNIANILSRVTGGNPSIINGILQVSGGDANLFLMNPSGILFGPSAQLDLGGSFAATTATGIEFNDGVFNALGANDFSNLSGNPTAFIFQEALVSPIINAGDLEVLAGETLSLSARSVVNTGSLTASDGNISIAIVPGQSRVRISQTNGILELEVPIPLGENGEPIAIQPLDLPQLLTRGEEEGIATGLNVNDDGAVEVTESGLVLPEQSGAIIPGELNGEADLLAGGNLLINTDLTINSDLTLSSGENIFIDGNISVSDETVDDEISLTAEANRNISVLGEIASETSPLNVTLNSDRDGNNSGGIVINPGSAINTNGGDLILGGGDDPLTTAAVGSEELINGVQIEGTLNSGGGDINIRGTGFAGANSNEGNAPIGVDIQTEFPEVSAQILAEGGNITIIGQGGGDGTGFNVRGVNIEESSVISTTDDGTITIEGTGGSGVDSNTGLFVSNASTITTENGDINFTGQGNSNATGSDNRGINIQGGSNVTSETGDLTLEGTGGSGIDNNIGIVIGNSTLQTETGEIEAIGEGGGLGTTGNGNSGIFIVQDDQSVFSASAITLQGLGGPNNSDSLQVIASFDGPLTLQAGNGAINGTIDGQETITIDDNLENNATELSADFSASGEIIINDTIILSGDQTLTASEITFNETINSDSTARNLTLNTTGNGSITFEDGVGTDAPLNNLDVATGGEVILRSGNITTLGNQIYDGSVILTEDTTFNGNDISFNDTVDSDSNGSQNLTIESDGITTFEAAVGSNAPLNNLETSAEGQINLNAGEVTTENDQTYNVPVTLGADTTLNGNNITFNSNIDTNGGGFNLEVNAEESITTENINTNGGNLNLTSDTEIEAGAIVTNGGEVRLQNTDQIPDPQEETLRVAPEDNNDIEVTSIDTSETDEGGNITVLTERFFRVTGTINDEFSIDSSNGGSVTINHGGDIDNPFEVNEDNPINGTVGEITSFDLTIQDGIFPFTEREGNLALISIEQDPDLPPDFDKPPEESPEVGVNTNTSYLNPTQLEAVSLTASREILSNIEKEAGVKAAVIYVRFTSVVDPISQAETIESQPSGSLAAELAANSQTNIVPEQEASSLFEELETESLTPYSNYYPGIDAAPSVLSAPQSTDQMEIIIVTADNEVTRTIVPDVKREAFQEVGLKLREEVLLNQYPGIIRLQKMRNQTHLEPAQILYNWMIKPVENQLEAQEIENLVFVLPSELRLIPLATLHDGEEYIVQKGYSVGLAPALSMINAQYQKVQETELLAMGTSEFPEIEGAASENELPAVPIELSQVVERWGGVKFVGSQFSIDQFNAVRRRAPYGIVHLATHANFTEFSPGSSYIRFYEDVLNLDQVRQLNLREVELLTLSACRTVFGDQNSELGFAGLAYQAGVKSVLGSLWQIDDAGTLAFMTKFYDQLKDENVAIKAEGVRKTQVDMIEGRIRIEGDQIVLGTEVINLPPESVQFESDLAHPYFWSGFTMVGSPW